jgi:hypothetical protein
MSRRWFREQFDQRVRDEANERREALIKIAAISQKKTRDEIELFGLTEDQINEVAIIQIRKILDDCV